MKIAFLSYEYPPETGGGGIGTYLCQCVEWLPKFGHKPVVFCGTNKNEPFWENEFVYRFPCTNINYNDKLLQYFIPIHHQIQFDIAEGTDYVAWGLPIVGHIKELPFCIKAHSAAFIVDSYLYHPLSFSQKLRFLLGAIKRFQIPRFPKPPTESNYLVEKKIVTESNLVISPSNSLANKYRALGWVNDFVIVPYPYSKIFDLTSIKNTKLTIVFFGRLEIRKGILDLIEAIPIVIRKHKNIVFKFVGNASRSPNHKMLMDEYITNKLNKFSSFITVEKAIPNAEIYKLFENGDIFVFPSLYDNFPLVCLETMSAGKAVIGSRSGGMAEIIEENISGLLVSPNSPKELAAKICTLIEDEILRNEIGRNAKKRILEKYHPDVIIPLQIETYQKLIDERKARK